MQDLHGTRPTGPFQAGSTGTRNLSQRPLWAVDTDHKMKPGPVALLSAPSYLQRHLHLPPALAHNGLIIPIEKSRQQAGRRAGGGVLSQRIQCVFKGPGLEVLHQSWSDFGQVLFFSGPVSLCTGRGCQRSQCQNSTVNFSLNPHIPEEQS